MLWENKARDTLDRERDECRNVEGTDRDKRGKILCINLSSYDIGITRIIKTIRNKTWEP